MTIYDLPKYMIICLILTLVIEIFMAFILRIKGKDLIIVGLVNLLTNPLLVSITTSIDFLYGSKIKLIVIIILEIIVLLIEGYIYKKNLTSKKINPYLLSLLLNLASYGAGLIIW